MKPPELEIVIKIYVTFTEHYVPRFMPKYLIYTISLAFQSKPMGH